MYGDDCIELKQRHRLFGKDVYYDISTGNVKLFLFFVSSTGHKPASLCHGPLSVRVLTFSLNIFFAETTYRILMKFHRNVPTMVLFRIS